MGESLIAGSAKGDLPAALGLLRLGTNINFRSLAVSGCQSTSIHGLILKISWSVHSADRTDCTYRCCRTRV
jgi:hypothetical protein